ncbi:hypothetical protein EHS25_009814 [Saitozyma podzolica]|uniref:Peptidase S54 rhomboid domain-containing protein n=1 Tax=Saitozyma podzolica TaxID=1890683 RepID=A0A427YKA0_9TREE|nr:hypothetical protein EHS25_009814 [Saitozyma podzolica]
MEAYGGVGGYTLAAWYTNEDTARWVERLGGGSFWRRGQSQPSDKEIARAKQLEAARQAQESLNKLPQTLSFLPRAILVPVLRIYVSAKEYAINTPPAQLAPMGLVVLWVLSSSRGGYLGWNRSCGNGSFTARSFSLSHQSFAHFAFNSFALYSFGSAAYTFLATPPPSSGAPLSSSTHTPHFIAFLLLAGLTSSLGSHLFTNLVRLPRLIRTLSSPARLSSPQALAAHEAILPSLGASGAIYAALTLTACAFPDSNVGIIFVPFISFPIGLGVAGMVAVDLVGLIRGWRMFDHVAHLGGAAFGLLYYEYGRQVWVWLRRQLGGKERGAGYV